MQLEPKELTEMPNFEADVMEIDPSTLAVMSPANRLLHQSLTTVRKEISILRKQNKWLADRMAETHRYVMHCEQGVERIRNRIEATERTIMGIPYRVLGWVMAGLGGALLAALGAKIASTFLK